MDADKTIIATKHEVGNDDSAHYLVGAAGTMAGHTIEIPNGHSIVGRRDTADIQIKDRAISGSHCRISVVPNIGLMIEDLGSSNGTFIDEKRITEPRMLPIGSFMQLGDSLFKHDYRSRQSVLEEQHLEGDLEKASSYVQSLLPKPIKEGAIRTEWQFIPSAKLGGDCFGYHWIDSDNFVIYLADVSGHGAAPALHSVSVINVLRKQSLPGIDFLQPAAVMKALNDTFQMSEHANLYLTFWYGVYNVKTRKLRYASGGHPPSFLLGEGVAEKLITKNFAVGMLPGVPFVDDEIEVPHATRLYIYSDGAYEVVIKNGEEWRIDDFYELLKSTPHVEVGEPQRVEQAVRDVMRDPNFDDDFSMLVVSFD